MARLNIIKSSLQIANICADDSQVGEGGNLLETTNFRLLCVTGECFPGSSPSLVLQVSLSLKGPKATPGSPY